MRLIVALRLERFADACCFRFLPVSQAKYFPDCIIEAADMEGKSEGTNTAGAIPANSFEERSFSGSWETRHLSDPEGRKKISQIRFSLQLCDE